MSAACWALAEYVALKLTLVSPTNSRKKLTVSRVAVWWAAEVVPALQPATLPVHPVGTASAGTKRLL
ncbi:MAG: hypothetical protein V9E99_03000 [Microthrixaceae bacterium]